MRFDCNRRSKIWECEKRVIVRGVAISTRDLRILSLVFSTLPTLLLEKEKERAMVVNLEFNKAIS